MCIRVVQLGCGQAPEAEKEWKNGKGILISLSPVPICILISGPFVLFPSLFNEFTKKAFSCENKDPYLPKTLGYFEVLPQDCSNDTFLSADCSRISQVSYSPAIPPTL